MIGHVNERLEPLITLKLIDTTQREFQVRAIVDTGFGGFLTLPTRVIQQAGFEWYSASRSELGDGSFAVFDVYLGTANLDDEQLDILIEVAETVPLAGMQLLRGKRLTIDAIDGGSVVISAIQ